MTDKSDCPPQVADNLPRDATGRVVPFDVAKVYNFKPGYAPRVVLGLKYSRNLGQWLFEFDNGAYGRCPNYYLDPPDSWERLEEDARKAPRGYIEGRGIEVGSDGRVAAMSQDIVRRAKALAGVSGND